MRQCEVVDKDVLHLLKRVAKLEKEIFSRKETLPSPAKPLTVAEEIKKELGPFVEINCLPDSTKIITLTKALGEAVQTLNENYYTHALGRILAILKGEK